MAGPGFVRSLHTPSVTGGSLSPRDTTATPDPVGQAGGSRPPSFPKPGKDITPGGRTEGQPRSRASRLDFWTHVSQQQQFQPPPCSFLRSKLSRRVMLSTETSPESLPHSQQEPARAGRGDLGSRAGQGGRASPAALPGPLPGPAPRARWAAVTTTSAPWGSHAAPREQPSIPKRDVTPQGPRDTPGVPWRCSEAGRVGCRG